MSRCIIIYFCVLCAVVSVNMFVHNSGPKYKPTEGEVWPQPQGEKKKLAYYAFSPAQFKINVTNEKCSILGNAIIRFIAVLKDLFRIARQNRRYKYQRTRADKGGKDKRYQGFIRELQLNLKEPCEDYPHFKMDESYSLTVGSTAVLTSDSIWGMLRGLETASQLFYFTSDFSEIRINATEIFDFPYYFHRGILVDTSRHYISPSNILKMLDAMAINKMNVFHWHIVDDHSFPYESEMFPELSKKGAYYPSLVYKKSDIKTIIEYARNRGIRVLPEFDVPGHTRSWGVSHPEILTQCYKKNKPIGLGPLHPLRKRTYKILLQLYREVQGLFPDRYLHIGGDEVNLDCWLSNPEIQKFMEEKNVSSIYEVHATFMHKIIELLGKRSTPIVWQEVYDNDVPLPKDAIVQIWKYRSIHQMIDAIQENVQVVFSAPWYLDYLDVSFATLYTSDPRTIVRNKVKDDVLENIVGGEACMWSEKVDDRNLFSRVWPRACAVAEVLWSVTSGNMPARTLRRVEEHACRMIRRGIPAEPPSGPGFCVT
ncbi:beta-hexosaminidase subunit beta-like [Pectinophora gossypiella]|uniref:beta-hexosaminidase subunit beta-like n=1 Tax=Pectinophora gossypiella TaxID=13191 RepID=UPI00214EF9C5|nr:beta-hexosaminidase subunit beta-like [Pectinophora gossypiella]